MFARNHSKTRSSDKLFYADLLATDLGTKEDLVSEENLSNHDQETYSEKEHALLKNFRELKPKKQKAILWLLSRLGKSAPLHIIRS
ncbi:transcriptional regulator [Bartonella tribocorum]|uniref:Uncharacterized protein n=1 Tax=Bartonella tribocorum (strain DSM 28219 / CCUG 45778 / CIP 105476 / IBS 506) TaxID=382640 RepID=A9IXR0_BART1|nr:hypothetical protein [Bartonella tribocorum]CAK02222.1 hypothetical protein predicted by Glimmer/Critica [Bartonella tribocorum CIP 105476]CDO49513.1 transcriptional regulator [Bartonella tribocorum]